MILDKNLMLWYDARKLVTRLFSHDIFLILDDNGYYFLLHPTDTHVFRVTLDEVRRTLEQSSVYSVAS